MKLKYEKGLVIEKREDLAGLPPIRSDQLRMIGKLTMGLEEFDAIFEECRREEVAFTCTPLVEVGGQGRRYDQWLYNMKHSVNGHLLAFCGAVLYADTVNDTGAWMIQHGWTVERTDTEAAEIIDAIEAMSES